MNMKRDWIVLAGVLVLGIGIGATAVNLPQASAAGANDITVHYDGTHVTYDEVESYIIDSGTIYIDRTNSKTIFNEEHWTYVDIRPAE